MNSILTEIKLNDIKFFRRGKVRDVYDLDDKLLIIASDRISAFDFVLPQAIPNKGYILTELTKFWFGLTSDIVGNHLITVDVDQYPKELIKYKNILQGRSMLVKKADVLPVECIVRGYIIGSGWKEYQTTGTVCGIKLPQGLKMAEKLPEPIFTPSTKAADGEHDENISIKQMEETIGKELTQKVIKASLDVYKKASEYALTKGIIIADTKFEFGLLNGKLILVDEVLTPDSSRFWSKKFYQTGISPKSFDKQIVRDYLEGISWDKKPPVPDLPEEIINKTASEYQRILDLLTH